MKINITTAAILKIIKLGAILKGVNIRGRANYRIGYTDELKDIKQLINHKNEPGVIDCLVNTNSGLCFGEDLLPIYNPSAVAAEDIADIRDDMAELAEMLSTEKPRLFASPYEKGKYRARKEVADLTAEISNYFARMYDDPDDYIY